MAKSSSKYQVLGVRFQGLGFRERAPGAGAHVCRVGKGGSPDLTITNCQLRVVARGQNPVPQMDTTGTLTCRSTAAGSSKPMAAPRRVTTWTFPIEAAKALIWCV